jgi:nucleotide-binding universal stress UspA family protein
MDCAIIVLASHGRGGLGALLLGSETQKVLAHADRPVLVVR